MEPATVSDWLDIVGSLQPFGQMEFLGFLVVSFSVLCVNEEGLLLAIAAVQLYQLPSDAWPASVLSILLAEAGVMLELFQPVTVVLVKFIVAAVLVDAQ